MKWIIPNDSYETQIYKQQHVQHRFNIRYIHVLKVVIKRMLNA